MSRKEEAEERAVLTALERVKDEALRRLWAKQALEIEYLPEAKPRNVPAAGRSALHAFGELEV